MVLGAVVAAVVGFAVAALVGVRVTDPVVQGAIVGALAGIAGGVVGATIGAWASRDVANRTIRDAKEARREARTDARRSALMEERRAAIVNFLTLARDLGRDTQTAADDIRRRRPFNVPTLTGIDHAWAAIVLFTPDLVPVADTLKKAIFTLSRATIHMAAERAAKAEPADESGLPPAVAAAVDGFLDAEAAFVVKASKHLGVYEYTDPSYFLEMEKVYRRTHNQTTDAEPPKEK